MTTRMTDDADGLDEAVELDMPLHGLNIVDARQHTVLRSMVQGRFRHDAPYPTAGPPAKFACPVPRRKVARGVVSAAVDTSLVDTNVAVVHPGGSANGGCGRGQPNVRPSRVHRGQRQEEPPLLVSVKSDHMRQNRAD